MMEAHLRAIAIWYKIGAVMGALSILGLLMAQNDGKIPGEYVAGLKVGVVMIAAFSVFSWMLGHYLAAYSAGGRIVARLVTFLSILMNVFGLVRPGGGLDQFKWGKIGLHVCFIAWLLMVAFILRNARTADICTEEYRALVKNTPGQTPPTFRSPFFLMPLIGTILSVISGLVYWKMRQG
jgi:hypothetical protein